MFKSKPNPENTGHFNTGYRNTGDCNTGNRNTGYGNTGDGNTGNYNTGSCNTGSGNTGLNNSGNNNTACCNTGHCNTGGENSGNFNTGRCNTGGRNSGDGNTGDRNTGDFNTGYRNTGDWNTGDRNTGSFNTITPEGGYYFNKWLSHEKWAAAKKPRWMFLPTLTKWVKSKNMTLKEKLENPDHETVDGYLRVNDMKEEWRKAYETATEEEVQMVRDLPNFDYDVFEEITGLDLRIPQRNNPCDGKIVEIEGKKYKLTEI